MTLSEEILRYRARHNMSQRDFAERCGVTVQTINSVENGRQDAGKLTETKIKLVLEGDESIESKRIAD